MPIDDVIGYTMLSIAAGGLFLAVWVAIIDIIKKKDWPLLFFIFMLIWISVGIILVAN